MAGNNCHVLTITSSQGNLNVTFCMDITVLNCLFFEMMLLLPQIVQLNGLSLCPNGRGTYLLGPYFVGAWNDRLLIALFNPNVVPKLLSFPYPGGEITTMIQTLSPVQEVYHHFFFFSLFSNNSRVRREIVVISLVLQLTHSCCSLPQHTFLFIVPESEKLGVVVSARVHPGETNASWMMKGMLDFLTSGHHIAEVPVVSSFPQTKWSIVNQLC